MGPPDNVGVRTPLSLMTMTSRLTRPIEARAEETGILPKDSVVTSGTWVPLVGTKQRTATHPRREARFAPLYRLVFRSSV